MFFRATFGFDEASSGDKSTGYRSLYDNTQRALAYFTQGQTNGLVNVRYPVLEIPPLDGGGPPRRLLMGSFETPSLRTLRKSVASCTAAPPAQPGTLLPVENVIGESGALHGEASNYMAVFQVASQFNCLEFVNPSCTPEMGITCYANDRTQGPACAIACAPGTALRNYLVWRRSNYAPLGERFGQRHDDQINCLDDADSLVRRKSNGSSLWTITNGYIEATDKQLTELNELLSNEAFREELKALIKIGVHWHTQVTNPDVIDAPRPHVVTQTFNSAIGIGYSSVQDLRLWEPFAKLVLDATYEATLLVAIEQLSHLAVGQPDLGVAPSSTPDTCTVYLTKVGGGVFRNNAEWIVEAMNRALAAIKPKIPENKRLRVLIVHYMSTERIYEKVTA